MCPGQNPESNQRRPDTTPGTGPISPTGHISARGARLPGGGASARNGRWRQVRSMRRACHGRRQTTVSEGEANGGEQHTDSTTDSPHTLERFPGRALNGEVCMRNPEALKGGASVRQECLHVPHTIRGDLLRSVTYLCYRIRLLEGQEERPGRPRRHRGSVICPVWCINKGSVTSRHLSIEA